MPPVIYVAIGLPGFIRCPVDANPPVTFVKWKKDGLPLRIDKVSLYVFTHFNPDHHVFDIIIFIFFYIILCFLMLLRLLIDTYLHAVLSTVPWLEPNGRWEHPCGRGDRGLSGHLYLHALQHPGFYGMVPSCSPGAKGTPFCNLGSFKQLLS